MSKKNRLEQPYGYREQDKYVSTPAMICGAIKDKKAAEEIAELLKDITSKALFDVRYDSGLKSFVFSNSEGTDVAMAKLFEIFVSSFVKNITYDSNDKGLTIIFENGDEIKLPLGEVVGLVEEEAKKREEGDKEIWEAIGELTDGKTTIIDLINEERTAREEGDKGLQETLDELTEEAQKWYSSIIEYLKEEVAARKKADDELSSAINEETERAVAEEEKLKALIGDLAEDAESGNMSLTDMINQEKEGRENGDKTLEEAISAEVTAREGVDAQLWEAYNSEATIREENDNKIQEALVQEAENRNTVETQLWEAYNGEAAIREENDNKIQEALVQEATNRGIVEAQLWGAINNEAEVRAQADTKLQEALEEEIKNRKEAEESIKNAVGGVKIEIAEPSSSSVKESYKLTNSEGEQLGETINIYKDSALKDVELIGEKDGSAGQYLKFTYVLEDGNEKVELLDVSTFLVESEFKNGFKVESSGEVSLLIDEVSEDYLTVSANGLKIKGVDAIATDLNNEKTTREAADITLDTKINEEILNRTTAIDEAVSEIDSKITTETTAREDGDKTLNDALESEVSARESADTALSEEITSVKGELQAEVSAREAKDTELNGELETLKSEGVLLVGRVNDLETALTAEENARAEAITSLEESLSKKANSLDVYYKTEADEKFATKEEVPTDFYGKEYINTQLNTLKDSLTAETQNRESEDATLNKMVTAETKARETAIETVQGSIDTINTTLSDKLDTLTSGSLGLAINKEGSSAVIDINLSNEGGQVMKVNADGIYASVDLSYDEDINTLFFKTSNKETETIKLKSKLEITKVYYERSNESIVIEYTVNGQRMDDVVFSVSSLINEWRVSENTSGAVKLSKTREVENGQDVLSAEVIISDHEDNALVNETGGALYVSKDKIIGDLEARVAVLENALSTMMRISLPKSTNNNVGSEEYIEED